MIKVLQVIGALNYGGIESVIMNYYRNIDRKRVQFDFITTGGGGRFEDEICKLGGNIFYLPSKSKHPFKYMKELKKIIEENHYDIVHSNTNSASAYLDLLPAKKAGCKIRIAHSHNTSCLIKWQHRLFKPLLSGVVTHRLACSTPAAKWLFGENKSVTIINNGIAFEKFSFNEKVRNEVRNRMGWENAHIVGNVASFQHRKNQRFLIDLMPELIKKLPNIKLVLVGNGETKNELQDLAKDMGIADKIEFLGNRNDINDLLQGFDVFVFPSIFEGLSVAYIEAAASGLPVIISDGVPIVKISDKVNQLPLNRELWLNGIVRAVEESETRKLTHEQVISSDYDIGVLANELMTYYEAVIK